VPARRDLASLPDRLAPPMPSHGLIGWIGPVVAMLIGGILRFVELGRPHAVMFDETYYPKDALSLLRFGVEVKTVEGADDILLSSDGNWQTVNVFTTEPAFVVHPPVGKWMIAAGEWLFGATPFGWRFTVALLGTLSILLVARIVRRLTRSDLIGTIAGLLLAVEGMHLVLSRTGLLDLVLAFWVIVAFGLLLIDRDSMRTRLARAVRTDGIAGMATQWGPRLGLRPWRWAAAAALGLAVATKWSGLWFLAFLMVMSVVWDVGARRMVGVQQPWRATFVRDALPAAAATLAIVAVLYVASWWGWFTSDLGYARNWAADQPPSMVPDALRSLLHYHSEAWNFHVGLTTEHSYSSNPLSWPFQSRPTSFFYDGFDGGGGDCGAASCASAVTALGNPIIWWFGILAVLYQGWRWLAGRDWRSGAVLVGIAAGWLPWLLYLDRTIFTFYTVVVSPFMVMAVAMTLGAMLGPPDAPPRRRRDGAIAVGVLMVLMIAAAWWFYPIWTGEVIPYDAWRLRMWFPSWI